MCTSQPSAMPALGIETPGSLPSTAEERGSASARRWPWCNRKRTSNMWNRRCAHGNAIFHAHRPRCRMDTSGSASGASKTTPSHVFAVPADRAGDPDRRCGGLHQANGADAERIAVGSKAVFVRICAFLSLILHQDIKASGSRWPSPRQHLVAGVVDGFPGLSPRGGPQRRPRTRGSGFLWVAHLRQRGLDPYTPAKTTWGADAHPGAPDVRTGGTAEAAARRGLAPRGPRRPGPQRTFGRGWERPGSPRDCCGFGAVRVCAPSAPPPRVAPRPAIP